MQPALKAPTMLFSPQKQTHCYRRAWLGKIQLGLEAQELRAIERALEAKPKASTQSNIVVQIRVLT